MKLSELHAIFIELLENNVNSERLSISTRQSERSKFFNQSKSPYLPMIYHQSNSHSLFKAQKKSRLYRFTPIHKSGVVIYYNNKELKQVPESLKGFFRRGVVQFHPSDGLGCSYMYLCCSYIRALGVKHGSKEWEEESEFLLLLLFSYIYENFDSSHMAQMNVDRVWSQIWTHG